MAHKRTIYSNKYLKGQVKRITKIFDEVRSQFVEDGLSDKALAVLVVAVLVDNLVGAASEESEG